MRFNSQQKSTNRLFQASWSVAALEPRLLLAADAGVAVAPDATAAIVDQPQAQPVSQFQVTHAKSVAFIDADLDGVGVLAQNLSADTEWVLLDPDRDLIEQISQTMSRFSGVSQIHLLTHGKHGAVALGDQIVDSQTLWQRADQIRAWSGSMTEDADILVYGCNSGSGGAGHAFVTALARLTQAEVAASTNVTGARDLGGDWDLELQLGSIEAPLLATAEARQQFRTTLDIVVNAWGRTGQESFDLLVDDQVVQSWDVQQAWQPYVYQTGELISADRVKVQFTNDLYDPSNGIDRNLHIDNVVMNGQKFESESSTTFSTGTWLASDGVTPGFGRGQTLHSNGFFQYGQTPSSDTVTFAGYDWNVTGGADASVQNGVLGITTANGQNAGLWTELNVQPGEELTLDIDGRRQTQGRQGSGQPIAPSAVGIDFFDASGQEIGELVVGVGSSRSDSVVVPAGATSATLWVWVQDLGPNVNVPGRAFLFDISVDTTNSQNNSRTLEAVLAEFDNNFPGFSPRYLPDVFVDNDGRQFRVAGGDIGFENTLLVRLTEDGNQVDATFGNNGLVTPRLISLSDPNGEGGAAMETTRLAFDSENNIYLIQNVLDVTSPRGAPTNTVTVLGYDFTRLTNHGELDSRFDSDGQLFVPFTEGDSIDSNSIYMVDVFVDDQDRVFVVGPKVERPFFSTFPFRGATQSTTGIASSNSTFRLDGTQLIEGSSLRLL